MTLKKGDIVTMPMEIGLLIVDRGCLTVKEIVSKVSQRGKQWIKDNKVTDSDIKLIDRALSRKKKDWWVE